MTPTEFRFVENNAGAANNVEIDTSVADTGPPTIMVTPQSGTKVKNGQRLTISVTAAEPPTGWQAGVKQIQIEDLDRHTNLEPWDNPAPAPQPCGNAGLTRTIERSYMVPPDVPLAHLKITARDYHNPQQTLLVEYPTGDWHGRFTWRHLCEGAGSRDETRGVADFMLDHDGRGNLTGRLTGSTPERTQTMPTCTFKYIEPSRFSAKLVGSYTSGPGDVFSPDRRAADHIRPRFLDLPGRDQRHRAAVLRGS